MALFDAATLNRFVEDGEDDFARDFPCIIDRLSLDIVASTAIYTLPDYVADIRRVTWLGYKVYPLSHRRFREFQLPAGSTAARPSDYIFDNIGRNQIKFYPTPSVTIASTNSNLYGSEIVNRVVIEYYRTPDHVSQIVPFYFRRRLLKAYVMKMCFSIEGRGQSIKAAKYWDSKWKYLKETYATLIDDLTNFPRRISVGNITVGTGRIPRPVLPYDKIGIGVETGE